MKKSHRRIVVLAMFASSVSVANVALAAHAVRTADQPIKPAR